MQAGRQVLATVQIQSFVSCAAALALPIHHLDTACCIVLPPIVMRFQYACVAV
jgi:hypothetical protein